MSTNYKTYTRTEEVKAYEVKEAHNVVTSDGLVAVQPGSFVTDDGRVLSADEFEGFKVKSAPRKRAASKSTKSAPKTTAAERVAAAKAKASGKGK